MSIEDKPGFRNASEILVKMSLDERKRILDSIAKVQPELAEALSKSFYQIDDLQYITPKMLVELLGDIDISIFSLALRGAKKETTEFLLSSVSSRIRDEIKDVLMGPPQLANHVTDAMDKVMEIVVDKIEKGQIVLSKDSSEIIID